jgi:hypothetical protein
VRSACSPPAGDSRASENSQGAQEEPSRICKACLQEISSQDLTPAGLHLCQDCLNKRVAAQQALRDLVSAQYVLLRPCKTVWPCLLKGLAFMPEAFRDRRAAEALAASLLKAGFPAEEAYSVLRKAAPGIGSGKVWALLADAAARGDWSCSELREKLGIDCQGCSMQFYLAPQMAAKPKPSQSGLS